MPVGPTVRVVPASGPDKPADFLLEYLLNDGEPHAHREGKQTLLRCAHELGERHRNFSRQVGCLKLWLGDDVWSGYGCHGWYLLWFRHPHLYHELVGGVEDHPQNLRTLRQPPLAFRGKLREHSRQHFWLRRTVVLAASCSEHPPGRRSPKPFGTLIRAIEPMPGYMARSMLITEPRVSCRPFPAQ